MYLYFCKLIISALARWALDISFDGTHYHGWQEQANANSVQETLANAISTALQTPTSVTGCGRTDTGVHAKQFILHFDAAQALNAYEHIHKLNAILPKDIAVKQLYRVTDDFHARFDAELRTYQYHLHYEKDPFKLNRSYQYVMGPLSVEKMNTAAKSLLEFEDFTSFSKSNTQVKTNNCHITKADWEMPDANTLVFTISANRFLRNMVRAIVGTLIEIGSRKREPKEMAAIIEARDRKKAGFSVPACGLYLTEVKYPNLPHE